MHICHILRRSHLIVKVKTILRFLELYRMYF